MARDTRTGRELRTDQYENGAHDDVGLKTLLSRLNSDASQFVHDELDLAKLELRGVTSTLSSDVKEAGKTLAKDLAKVGFALSLGLMGGLALTAGAVLAIGELLGGAYWAGGLIVGAVLLIAATISGRSAVTDAKESDALRLENTRDSISESKEVLAGEVRDTKDFAQREAREFKQHATDASAVHQPH